MSKNGVLGFLSSLLSHAFNSGEFFGRLEEIAWRKWWLLGGLGWLTAGS
jgi:hypothetical protein